jgi:integrase
VRKGFGGWGAQGLQRDHVARASGAEILGHADVRTTLAIYTHAMKRKHDNSADKMAEIAGLTAHGNTLETKGSVKQRLRKA